MAVVDVAASSSIVGVAQPPPGGATSIVTAIVTPGAIPGIRPGVAGIAGIAAINPCVSPGVTAPLVPK